MQQDISGATFFSRLFNMTSVVFPSSMLISFSMLEGCISIVDENGCSIIMTLPVSTGRVRLVGCVRVEDSIYRRLLMTSR
jgi:hypothetical protein